MVVEDRRANVVQFSNGVDRNLRKLSAVVFVSSILRIQRCKTIVLWQRTLDRFIQPVVMVLDGLDPPRGVLILPSDPNHSQQVVEGQPLHIFLFNVYTCTLGRPPFIGLS